MLFKRVSGVLKTVTKVPTEVGDDQHQCSHLLKGMYVVCIGCRVLMPTQTVVAHHPLGQEVEMEQDPMVVLMYWEYKLRLAKFGVCLCISMGQFTQPFFRY